MIPIIERQNMNHRSGLDACKIELSKLTNKKRTKRIDHEKTKYLESIFFNMNVSDNPDNPHTNALKKKGGSGYTNWKIFKTMNSEDKKGYFRTA